MACQHSGDARLSGFECFPHNDGSYEHDVYVTGKPTDRPLLVMHELPGFTVAVCTISSAGPNSPSGPSSTAVTWPLVADTDSRKRSKIMSARPRPACFACVRRYAIGGRAAAFILCVAVRQRRILVTTFHIGFPDEIHLL